MPGKGRGRPGSRGAACGPSDSEFQWLKHQSLAYLLIYANSNIGSMQIAGYALCSTCFLFIRSHEYTSSQKLLGGKAQFKNNGKRLCVT